MMALLLLVPVLANAHVRTIYPKTDDLLAVKTAIGIATIIQLPETIQTAIIGDQSGFKVEYIDKAVTVKPLRYGAKTNLYLITSGERFNLTLMPSAQDQADYVVYVRKQAKVPSIKWRSFERMAESKPLIIKLKKIGSTEDGFLILDGILESSTVGKMEPKDFWVYQREQSKPIHSIFLSSREVKKSAPIRWTTAIAKADLEKAPVRIVLKGQTSISIDIPETAWR